MKLYGFSKSKIFEQLIFNSKTMEATVIVRDSLDIISMACFETLVLAPAALVLSKSNEDVESHKLSLGRADCVDPANFEGERIIDKFSFGFLIVAEPEIKPASHSFLLDVYDLNAAPYRNLKMKALK